jgi:hypothetical protein
MVSSIIFVTSLVAFCSLFTFKIILLKQIAKADDDLVKAKSAFQVEKIQELVDANTRISSTKRILNTHVSTSKLLYLMQDLIVKKVRLTRLTYSKENNIPTLLFTGEAQSYNAIADQSNIFSLNKYIVNPTFGDFALQDSGYIKISFTSGIDTSVISYKDNVESTASENTAEDTQTQP